MIVTCPGCDSNYRVPNEKVPPGGARMRCPLCSTDFLAKLPDDDSPDTPLTPPKPKVPPLPAAASSSGLAPPVPSASGGLPLPAARPNPFAKAPAATSSPASPPFAERSLPPYASPPGTPVAYPPPPAPPAPAAGPAPFGSAAPAGPPSPAPFDTGAYGAGIAAETGTPPPPPATSSPAPFPLATPPTPQPPAYTPPPPYPPPQYAPAPAYTAPPAPPAAAYAPAPTPPAPPGFAPPPSPAIPPPVPAGVYPGAGYAPPPPPPGALVGPSPPPTAPTADGDVFDFDPLSDEIFGDGGPGKGSAAVPREVTGIFPLPNLDDAFPPAAGRPPPLAPQPVSSPNAGYAVPPASPTSPFGGASYPPAGVPAQDGPGDFDSLDFSSPGLSADLPPDEGSAPAPGGPPAASPTPSGPSFPLAGAAPGDDDDPFAAVFDAALAAAADPPPPQPSAADASASFAATPEATPDEGKAGMKAALARAMDAKRRAGALKEEQSPTSRGFDAPAFSVEDPSREIAVEEPAQLTADPAAPIAGGATAAGPTAAGPTAAGAAQELPIAPRPPPPAEPPPSAQKTPRRKLPRAVREGAAWGALAASTVVLVGGLVVTGWTLGELPLDDTLMPLAERQLGVRPPWSFIGLDERPLNELEKAAEKARAERDLAVEASAWRRVLVRAPEHEDARRRLRKLLALLGEARGLNDVTPK